MLQKLYYKEQACISHFLETGQLIQSSVQELTFVAKRASI